MRGIFQNQYPFPDSIPARNSFPNSGRCGYNAAQQLMKTWGRNGDERLLMAGQRQVMAGLGLVHRSSVLVEGIPLLDLRGFTSSKKPPKSVDY